MNLVMIRDDSIHVTHATRRALFFLPHTEDCPTMDAWADRIIGEWLSLHHPDIVRHVDAQEKADEALKKMKKDAAT